MTNSLRKPPADIRDSLRRELLEVIIHRGMTQAELAQRTFLSEAYLSKVCNQHRYPSLYAVLALLQECGFELQIVPKQAMESTNGHQ